jgi:molecular chaperone DnaJ
MKRDYYEVLGLRKSATPDDVKRAFRQLAMRYHPDKNPGDAAAEELFKHVNEAYAVLSDPERRAHYDRFGHFGPGGAVAPEGVSEALGDIFNELFASRRRKTGAQPGSDLRYTLEVSFEQAASGCEQEIVVPRLVPCARCGESGAEPPSSPLPCASCAGQGDLRVQQGFFTVARACPDCGGLGKRIAEPCADCDGLGRAKGERRLKVRVPPGVDTGRRLRLRGEGEEGTRGGPPGDLFVTVRVRPHPIFVRDEADVVCELPVSFVQAALGATVDVPTLDGPVRMRIPAGTQSGKIFRLREKGVRAVRGFGRGDLLVRVAVETPTRLSDAQKEALRRFAEVSGDDAHPQRKSFMEKMRDLLD